jgi:lysozyme family protein
MPTSNAALTKLNQGRWGKAKPTRVSVASSVAKRLVASKARYQTVEAKTGVPWSVIAVIHEREASQDWNTHLGQGDPLDKVTTHVPAGRGPFFGPDAWERGAIDALVDCAPFLARKKNWNTPGDVLTNLEAYNGLRYANEDRPSPYVWSGTSIYDPPTGPGGKVQRDHGPIDPVVDKQLGCAAMLMAMVALDPSIKLGGGPSPKAVATVGGTGAVVAGTVVTGVHHGWPLSYWLIAASAAIVIGAIAFAIFKSKKAD